MARATASEAIQDVVRLLSRYGFAAHADGEDGLRAWAIPDGRLLAHVRAEPLHALAVHGDTLYLGLRGPVLRGWACVLEVFPVLPLIANEPLGVGALSYAGRFTIGVVADRDAYPDLDAFAAGLRELHPLGVPTHPTSIRPTGEMVTHVSAQD
jgi:hypothetical protein